MAKRIPVSGEIISKDKDKPAEKGPCPNCKNGRVNGKACIACGGAGTRRS